MKLHSNWFRFDIFITRCLGGPFLPNTEMVSICNSVDLR